MAIASARDGVGGVSRTWRVGVVLSLAMVAAVLVADLSTHSLNLSILYTIPMYVLAMHLRARWVGAIAIVLAVMGYGGLFLGARPPTLPTAGDLLQDYRFVNRSLAVLAILATGLMAGWQRRWSERMVERVGDDERLHDHPIHLDLMDQVRFFATLLIALAITASVVWADWTSMAEINLPILYAVPLVLCVLSGSLRMIWLMAPVLVCLTWAGFWISDAKMEIGTIHPLVNRSIATLMLVALALVATYRVRRGRR